MIIGVPIEIKAQEYRVGLTPNHAMAYIKAGHTVYVQKGAGTGSGIEDIDYVAVGCKILPTIEEIYAKCEMIIKVKEPLSAEYPLIRENQILYTYLHLAASRELTDAMLKSKCIGIAYETITDRFGRLPCLKPMSEIAGRLAIQEGSKYLEKPFKGMGKLLGGVPGVLPATVVVLGAGSVGKNAVQMAVGVGADVTVMDISLDALTSLDDKYAGRVKTLFSSEANIIDALKTADLVIGCALIPGAETPQLIKKEYLKYMKKGALIVDVAIDQGGCAQSSHVTYHNDPIFEVDGIMHYCVGNMPGAVPITSTYALNNATLNYGLEIANKGVDKAVEDNAGIKNGLNVYKGKCTCAPVCKLFNI